VKEKSIISLTVISFIFFLIILGYILLFQDKFQLTPDEAIKSVYQDNGSLVIELTELVEFAELYEEYYDGTQSYTLVAMGSRRSYQYGMKKETETIRILDYDGRTPVFYHQIIPSQYSYYEPQVVISGEATLSECNFVIFPRTAIQFYGIAAAAGSLVSLLPAYLSRKRSHLLKIFVFITIFLCAYHSVFLIAGYITYQMETLMILQLTASLFLTSAFIGVWSVFKRKKNNGMEF
jgi:hypothetical protein